MASKRGRRRRRGKLKATKKRGISYEEFIQSVYQSLIGGAPGLNTIAVQHNVVLRGRSGCDHQFDVYWEFQLAGVQYNTAIECKEWSGRVPIGRVRDFFGACHDVGIKSAVVVTSKGFQSGALAFANHYGINPLVIQVP